MRFRGVAGVKPIVQRGPLSLSRLAAIGQSFSLDAWRVVMHAIWFHNLPFLPTVLSAYLSDCPHARRPIKKADDTPRMLNASAALAWSFIARKFIGKFTILLLQLLGFRHRILRPPQAPSVA